MTTYININKNVIAANAKHHRNDPPIRISRGKSGKPVYAHEIEIKGSSRLIYSADRPILPCGARRAIATEADVEILAQDHEIRSLPRAARSLSARSSQ
jgi:hypothetical protein